MEKDDLQAMELRLQLFLDALPIGVFVIDTAGRLYYANAAAQTILGQRGPDETDPTKLAEVYRAFRAGTDQLYPVGELPIVRALSGETTMVSDMEIEHPDRRVPIEVWASPIRSADGRITHAIAGFYDISERKHIEEQTQRRLRHLSALRAIDMAITASLDLRVTLSVFLDQVTAQLRVDAADVLLLNSHSQVLEYALGRGFQGTAITRTRLNLGQGIAGRSAIERRTMSVPNLAEARGEFTRAGLLAGEQFRAYYATPLVAKGQVRGILEVFHRGPLQPDAEWISFFEALAGQAAIAIDNEALFTELTRSNVNLAIAYDTTLEGWSKALDLRDRETEGHTLRVTEVTLHLAQAVGISEAGLIDVRRGSLLHDIGKMGIPDAILHKPGPLDEDEWRIMRQHPVFAFDLLQPIEFLRRALDIPYCHHEKWDGTGYPRKLKGEGIPLAARVFSVVDVWDALRSPRPYRSAWPEERVRAYLRERSGVDFDPSIVDAFLELDLSGFAVA